MSKQKKKTGYQAQDRMSKTIEDIRRFEEFEAKILPFLKGLIHDSGKSADEMAKLFEKHALARVITEAMTASDPAKALAAAKEVLDRSMGKAAQKVETTHKYEKLKDEELDALIDSELESLDEIN